MTAKRILRATALSPLCLALALILFVASVPIGLVGSILHQLTFDGEDSLETAVLQYAGRIPFIAACHFAAQAVEVWRLAPRTAGARSG